MEMDLRKMLKGARDVCVRHSALIVCFLCFLCTFFYLATYMRPFNSVIVGHDHLYHYLRLESLAYNFKTNNLFSGIDYFFFDGAGYASFAYPSLFLCIPAVLRALGLGLSQSMAIFLLLCNGFSYLTMFMFAKKISKSTVCGTIAAVLYVLSTYRLDNIITRVALGEVQAYVFWPVILYGLYDFIFDGFKKPWIIGIGFVGMILSHTISTALALGLCVLVSLIFIRRILKDSKRLLDLFVTVCCVVLVTAYWWMPLLEMLDSCEMAVKDTAYDTMDSVLSFEDLFKDNAYNHVAGMRFPIFLLLIPRLFLTRKSPIAQAYLRDINTKKRKDILHIADVFAILGVVSALMSTKIVPWKILSKFLNFMQFPWRFFAPASLLIITAGAIYLYYIVKYTKAQRITMVVITCVAILIAAVHTKMSIITHIERVDDYYNTVTDSKYMIGSGEWLPLAVKDYNTLNLIRELQDNVLLNTHTKIPCERENGTLTFYLDEEEAADSVRLPYIWYKGYTATDENGNELPVYMSFNGLVQVDIQGVSGTVTVEHKPTTVRIISCVVSVLSVVVLISLFAISRLKSTPRKFRQGKTDAV